MPFNSIFSWFIKKRIHQIELFKKYPLEVQNDVLKNLLEKSAGTEFAKKNNFGSIREQNDFRKNVPLSDYESIAPFVERLLKNEQNLLWSSEIKWFAKSSGTTTGRSKFIPV